MFFLSLLPPSRQNSNLWLKVKGKTHGSVQHKHLTVDIQMYKSHSIFILFPQCFAKSLPFQCWQNSGLCGTGLKGQYTDWSNINSLHLLTCRYKNTHTTRKPWNYISTINLPLSASLRGDFKNIAEKDDDTGNKLFFLSFFHYVFYLLHENVHCLSHSIVCKMLSK